MEYFDIKKIHAGKITDETIPVSEEVPLTIEINGKELSTLLCSPIDLENLITGFLYTSGFFNDISSIKNIIIDRQQWKANVEMDSPELPEDFAFKRIYTSGCGKGIVFHNPLDIMNQETIEDNYRVKSSSIEKLIRSFLGGSEEHKKTRGVHSSAIATEEEILLFKDDIGRHNSVDKVIGEALSRNISLEEKMILTSGRLSSEIISKILMCKCPVLVAASAPTNQAVKLAKSINLTLVGLARGKFMIVYSGEQRIV